MPIDTPLKETRTEVSITIWCTRTNYDTHNVPCIPLKSQPQGLCPSE